MSDNPFSFEAPRLDPQDQSLIDAYRSVGRPLDELPYTGAFDDLVRKAGRQLDDATKHQVFRRLLYLRKTARLPSVLCDFLPAR